MTCGDSLTTGFTEFIQHVDEYLTRLDLFPRPIKFLRSIRLKGNEIVGLTMIVICPKPFADK